ncbi:protein kinase [Hamiltosporidium tvaerminnensis]|uniref:Protein kinase n=2 Tax=Hamiltosporidium TaxID=1176354 RepID=A0A4Q9LD64_9MICR|nr:protein kinase [Hamiltosporidium tvaerminnensis]TBU05903.1 protein kinase [Hamiltosporidium magnivora]
MKRTISMEIEHEEVLLKYINVSVENCLQEKTRNEQNKAFQMLKSYLPVKPIKMTQITAVFLYSGKKIPLVIKRVVLRKDSPSFEDIVSMRLKHPNVLQTYHTFKTSFINSKDEKQDILWLISEFLTEKVTQKMVSRDEELIKIIITDVLNGLNYMHKQNIAHLDMKIANVMGEQSGTKISYKLIDFGYSRDLNKEPNLHSKNEVVIPHKSYGTFPYKPPEVVFENAHGLKADIWCVGAISWFLSLGKTPFYTEDGDKNIEEYKKFVSGKTKHFFKGEISPELEDFILRAMNPNRHHRPTADQLLKHAFITGETLNDVRSDSYSNDSGYESFSDSYDSQ